MTRDKYGQAFEENFDRTVRALMARGVTVDQAWEIAQATWARGWEKCGQLRDDRRVVAWINAIGRNILRSARRQKRFLQLSEIEEPLGRPMNGDAAIDVDRVLDDCSASDRQLLTQCYLLGCSGNELARGRKVTTAAIHCALLRARRRAAMYLNPTPTQKKKLA
jgi:DNA-directed RNA polymerase specialized sigma24 family protein